MWWYGVTQSNTRARTEQNNAVMLAPQTVRVTPHDPAREQPGSRDRDHACADWPADESTVTPPGFSLSLSSRLPHRIDEARRSSTATLLRALHCFTCPLCAAAIPTLGLGGRLVRSRPRRQKGAILLRSDRPIVPFPSFPANLPIIPNCHLACPAKLLPLLLTFSLSSSHSPAQLALSLTDTVPIHPQPLCSWLVVNSLGCAPALRSEEELCASRYHVVLTRLV